MKETAVSLLLFCTLPASAHVVVNPPQVAIGRFQTFTVSVPVEKNQPTIGVRLVMPQGLEAVLPTVKPGWTIEIVTAPDGERASSVAEIRWSGGSIPAGRRDDFSFSARLPARETVLAWKAYQSYADGSVVAWDRDPKLAPPRSEKGEPDFSRSGPWSQTRVIDDLKEPSASGADDTALWVSIAALVVSVIALVLAWSARRRR